MTAGAALSRELRFTGTSVPPSLGSTEKRLEGPGAFGLRVRQAAAVFAGTPVPAGLASQAFGPGRWRCSGPRAGGRPSIKGRFLRERPGEIGWHASHRPGAENPFGGHPSGAGNRIALHIPVFGGKVPVELRPSPFRRGRLPLPVSGGRPIRDRAVPSWNCAKVSPAKEGTRQGADPVREAHPQGAALEAWKRQPVRPVPPTVRTGSLGTLPAPRDGPGRCP